MSGTRSSFTNLTLDGVNIQDNFIRANAVNFSPNRPTVQQVAEFTIITQNQGPEAGFGSSQVSLVTPSGTNEFHGELFWFYRSDGLAANSFFNNLAGLEKPNLVRNQFGFTLAGPFVKDRLLFFAHYEGQRVRRGLGQDTLILTPDARQGIFTYEDLEGNIRKLNILGAAEVPIDPFVANLLKNIPTDINNFLVGDSSQNLLMNNAGHRLIQNFNNNRAQGGLRLDFLLSDDQSFEWTYKVVDDEQDRPDIYEGFNRDPKIKTISKFNHFFSGAWRWVMAPTMLNEVRVGGHQGPVVFDTFEDFSAGFKICPVCDGLQNPLVFSNPVDNFERQGRNTNTYTIQDNASWQRGAHSVRFGFQTQFIRSLDFGSFDVIPTYELGLSPVNPTGLGPGDFPGGTSAAAATNANNLLAALGGILASGRQEFNVPLRGSPFQAIEDRKNWEYDTFAFYFGDAWRIHPRITFNVGLRWEYYLQLKERGDLITQPEIRSGQTMRDAVLDPEGQINFITEDLTNADLNNWAPNIGIAWDPFGDGRTALRAGYGISYANDEGISAARNAINRYGVQAVVTRQNLTGSISQGLPDFSTPEFKLPLTYREIDATIEQVPVAFGVDPNRVIPYVQSWNFGVQREVAFDMAFEVRYVGTRGTKLVRSFDYNQVIIGPNGFLADFLRARQNGFLALDAGLGFDPEFNPDLPGSRPLTVIKQTVAGGLLFIPFLRGLIHSGEVGELAAIYHFNGLAGNVQLAQNPVTAVSDVATNSASSTYHGLQFDLRRRFRSGLMFNANYTFSKVLTDASSGGNSGQFRFEAFTDLQNPRYDRGRAEFDTTHIFNANFILELPFGKGRHFHIEDRVLDKILGGWELTSIFSWQSGPPFSIRSSRGTLNRSGRSFKNTANSPLDNSGIRDRLGVGSDGGGPYFLSRSVVGSDGRAVAPDGQPAFTGQIFFNPGPGTLGNLPRFGFTGPFFFNWDLGVIKQFQITEEVGLQFRAELFNLPNHNSFFLGGSLFEQSGETNINSPQFGRLSESNSSPRVVQFALKLFW